MEREADKFASFLLMPINDFRQQVAAHWMTLELMGHCASRYQVSLTAATLKWLSFTEHAAILVTAREGMVLWWRASDSARRLAVAHLLGSHATGVTDIRRKPHGWHRRVDVVLQHRQECLLSVARLGAVVSILKIAF